MLQDSPCFSSPCYSYLVNYRIQHRLYECLDNFTPPENDCVRIPGMFVWTLSTLVTLATRVTGVAEVLIVGIGTFFIDPKTGLKEVFIHAPKNVIRLTSTPFMFVTGTISTLMEPKFFTMHILECAKVNLKHAENKTIGTKKHAKNLGHVFTVIKKNFMEYQQKFWDIHQKTTWSWL